jgi:hypothetical protein
MNIKKGTPCWKDMALDATKTKKKWVRPLVLKTEEEKWLISVNSKR